MLTKEGDTLMHDQFTSSNDEEIIEYLGINDLDKKTI